ncbi:EamA domain - like 10 [Theobroma cacao]|nr:EamA domain - like 10 [Theobroma cacao]
MGQIVNILHGLKPAMLMVVVQVVFAGVNVLYKLAANDGMSLRIIVAYRFIFATAVMIPLALILERKRPKLTWTVLIQAFFCGLLGGSLSQNLYIESLALTSATFVSAMTNLIPAITFIMAVTIGLEKLAFGTMAGRAKVLGTVIGIGGAMLLTFYKGFQINMGSKHLDLLRHGRHGASSHAGSAHHLLGALLALCSCISYALWLNIQAKMSEKYPCYYSSTALICIMGAIQAVVFALCTEKDRSQWKLGWNIRLLTVAYGGILASGLMFSLVSWCVRMRGPLYASVFNPLMLVMVAFAGSLFLEEKLYLGSIIGAVLIVLGLYVVLWGKGKEMKKMNQLVPSASSPQNGPIEIIVTSSADNTSNNNNVIAKRKMGKVSTILQGLKPAMVMVVVQTTFAGMNLLYKLAANDGMSLRIITAYRFVFAVPVMVPLALLVERKRPKLTWAILFQAFLCGLFGGALSQNLYIASLALTSATFVSAMTNLIPVTTFILAVFLRMEKLAFGTMAGKAKVLGTLIGIGGAMLLTFYKGVQIKMWSTHIDLVHHGGHGASSHSASAHTLWGALLAFTSCITYTLWLIVQAKMSKKYPCPYSTTALMCVMGAIQSIVYALCTERDWSQWKLGWNTLFLGAKLYLGSILGAVLIVLGLYVVLWGKGKEMEKVAAPSKEGPSTRSLPGDESIEITINSPNGNSSNNNQNNV